MPTRWPRLRLCLPLLRHLRTVHRATCHTYGVSLRNLRGPQGRGEGKCWFLSDGQTKTAVGARASARQREREKGRETGKRGGSVTHPGAGIWIGLDWVRAALNTLSYLHATRAMSLPIQCAVAVAVVYANLCAIKSGAGHLTRCCRWMRHGNALG